MRRLCFLLLAAAISGCSSFGIRDDLDLDLFPTKMDIPSLDVSVMVYDATGKISDSRFSAAPVLRIHSAVYVPSGQQCAIQLYTMRTADPLHAYALLSAFRSETCLYVPVIDAYMSGTEGVLRRGNLCVYVYASTKYPMSATDISDILSFAANHEKNPGESIPVPASALSSKEIPLKYSFGPLETLYGLDCVFYGKSPMFGKADFVFCSRRETPAAAAKALQSMMANCRGGMVLFESSEDQSVLLKDSSMKPLFAGKSGHWVYGISGDIPPEQGRLMMKELAAKTGGFEPAVIEKD